MCIGLSIDPANLTQPDSKGLGWVEWMLGSGLGPIFESALGLGRFRVQPDPTDLIKKIKKKPTHTTNVSDKHETMV